MLAISILACGGLIILLAFYARFFTPLFIGGLNLLIGSLMLVMPQLVIHRSRIEVKNVFGVTVMTREFEFPRQLELENSVLYLNRDGKREKITSVNKLLSDPRDISSLKYFIAMQAGLTPIQQ